MRGRRAPTRAQARGACYACDMTRSADRALVSLLGLVLVACAPAAREPPAVRVAEDAPAPQRVRTAEPAPEGEPEPTPAPDGGAAPPAGALPDAAPGGVIVAAPAHEARPELPLPASVRARLSAGARRCYERALKDTPQLSGRLVIELETDGQGRITTARRSHASTIASPAFESCVLAAARSLAVPATDDGAPAKTAVTLVFRPE